MQDLLPVKYIKIPMAAKPKQLTIFFSHDLALPAKIIRHPQLPNQQITIYGN